jgi:uncharacterized phiE125 gp8 family phage protein
METRPTLQRLSDAGLEPVSLAAALNYLRVTEADESPLVEALVTASREWIEDQTGRALTTGQSWQLSAPTWEAITRPDGLTIRLPRCPLRSITAVRYRAEGSAVYTALPSSAYTAVAAEPAFLVLASDYGAPALADHPEAVQVEWVAGYASPEAVPRTLWQAVLMMASQGYEHRVPVEAGSLSEVPLGLRALVEPQRVEGFLA